MGVSLRCASQGSMEGVGKTTKRGRRGTISRGGGTLAVMGNAVCVATCCTVATRRVVQGPARDIMAVVIFRAARRGTALRVLTWKVLYLYSCTGLGCMHGQHALVGDAVS